MVWDAEALRPGEWLVTPTRRLAHHLKSRWDAEQAAQGRSVWRTPLVLDWRGLIERMFATDRAEGRLHARWLDGVSAALKWEMLVRNDAALGEDDARALDDPLEPAGGELLDRDEQDVALADDPAESLWMRARAHRASSFRRAPATAHRSSRRCPSRGRIS